MLAPYLRVLQCVAVCSSMLQCVTLLQCIHHISLVCVCVCVCVCTRARCVRERSTFTPCTKYSSSKEPCILLKKPYIPSTDTNISSKEQSSVKRGLHSMKRVPCSVKRALHSSHTHTLSYHMPIFSQHDAR